MSYRLLSGDYFFTEEHEWVRLVNNIVYVGLTTHAKKDLGRIENIEIHTIGKNLSENQVFGRIRTSRYLVKLIMPIRGKVIEASTIDYFGFNNLEKEFDPEEWIVKIEVALPLRTEKLYSLEEYKKHQTENALHLVKYFLRFGD